MVGRQAELAALTAAARSAVSGRGSAAVILGEPGIGKTHLLESFTQAATDLGFTVCVAPAYELEQHRPFGVLLDAFGVRPGVSDSRLARLATRVEAPGPAGEAAPTGFWLGEELLAVVDEWCARAPLAVVVDDVQWVDPASLALLARIVRTASQQRLLIVLSVRPPPRSEAVTRLVTGIAAAGGPQLTVGPLARGEIAELVAEQVGAPPGDSLWKLLEVTGGSPLFARELIAGLRADGALRIESQHVETDATSIPESLSVAVRHHLTQFDRDTIDVLRLAAVLGGPFTLPQLSDVTGRRPVDLYATVGATLDAGVLSEDGSRLRFAHDVIRTTLYDDIPPAVRVGIHRDIAGTLAAAGAPALDVSEHYLRGATPGDRDAVRGIRAAATAVAGQAPGTAADLLERAAALLTSDDPEKLTLARERARYLAAAGRSVEAEALCRELLGMVQVVAAERQIRTTLARVLMNRSRVREALDEARSIVAATSPDTAERVHAMAGLSLALLTTGQFGDAEQIANETIELATVGAPSAAYGARMTLALLCRFTARAAAGLEHLDAAADVATTAPREVVEANPVEVWRALLSLDLDRLDEALHWAHRGREAAEQAGVSFALALYQFTTGSTLHARGEIDDAVAEYRAGMELAEELGTGWRLSAYGALASIAVHRDDLGAAAQLVADGDAYLRRTGDQPQLPLFLRAKSELLEAQGLAADALAVLAGVWRPLLAADVLGSVPFFAPDVVRLAVDEGDAELAEMMAAAARTAAQRLGTSTAEAAALRCHGITGGALDAFVAAAETVVDNPRPLVRAGAHEDAGRALAAAGRVEDARPYLVAAIDTYERLGAVRDVGRIASAARAAGVRRGQRGRRGRPTHGWESLTLTELRVAELVASGLSNPVIAERMFLSRRTVQTHVSHILAKIGLSSRVELAAAMARQGG